MHQWKKSMMLLLLVAVVIMLPGTEGSWVYLDFGMHNNLEYEL